MGYPVGLKLSVHGHCVVHGRGGLVDPRLKGCFIKVQLWPGNGVLVAHPICDLLSLFGVHLALVVKLSRNHGTWRNHGGLRAPRYWQSGPWLATTFKLIELYELSDVIIQHKRLKVTPSSVTLQLFASSTHVLWSKCRRKSPNESNWNMRLGL